MCLLDIKGTDKTISPQLFGQLSVSGFLGGTENRAVVTSEEDNAHGVGSLRPAGTALFLI